MNTILKSFNFTDVDSRSVLDSNDKRFYYPFEGEAQGIDVAKGLNVTGVTSGAVVKLIADLIDNDLIFYGKLISGTPETSGESWTNSVGQTVFIGTGGYREGENNYLVMGDEYYYKLLRDYGISADDENLVLPPIYQIKNAMICHVEHEIFKDLIRDSRAPFDGQEILTDKYQEKRDDAEKCLNKWESQIDENAFYNGSKSTDSIIVTTYFRS